MSLRTPPHRSSSLSAVLAIGALATCVDPPAWRGTRLAMEPRVLSRLLVAAALFLPAVPAAAEPLWAAERRAGYGVAVGGGAGMAGVRTSPLTLELTGAIAVVDQPRVLAVAGVIAETLDRSAVGGVGGVRLDPRFHGLRLGAGMTYFAAPYTLWGPSAAAGVCRRVGRVLSGCVDVQATFFVGGNDLPDDKASSQFQLVLGVAVDDG